MKNILKLITLSGILSLSLGSCTKDFDTINIDPNNPAQPNTALLLSNAMSWIGDQNGGIAGWAKDIFPQYISEIQYTNESRFQNKVYSFNTFYNGPLTDLQTVINLNTDESTAGETYVGAGGSTGNQLGVSRILQSFFYLHMTDRWGRIPYSEALQGAGNFQPKYDAQQDIYTGIFQTLKEAVAQLNPDEALNGDILFDGDIAQWIKFANTLRMVAALHLSNVDEATARAEFTDASNSSIVSSVDENIYYKYLANADYQSPFYNNYLSRIDYAPSEKLISVLKDLSDPRLPIYALPVANTTSSYVGMPYGLINADPAYSRSRISLIGDKFTAQDYWLPIISYSQVQFMMAEAAFRGWVSGSAEDYYRAGIEASMEEQGVTAPESYYTRNGVAYNAANALELIITQKWLANYLGNGYESWTDWRRTGFPTLDPGPSPLSDDGEIPRRQGYDNLEQGLNGISYKDAIAQQGPDEFSTHIWWDGGNP